MSPRTDGRIIFRRSIFFAFAYLICVLRLYLAQGIITQLSDEEVVATINKTIPLVKTLGLENMTNEEARREVFVDFGTLPCEIPVDEKMKAKILLPYEIPSDETLEAKILLYSFLEVYYLILIREKQP